MDGVYLLDKVFAWRRLWYRGRYIVYLLLQWNFSIFSRGGLWYWKYCSVFHLLFHGEDGEFWIPFHAGNCNALWTISNVSLQIFRQLIAKLWFDTLRIFRFKSERYRIPFLRPRLRPYGLCFEVKGEILDLNHAKFMADVRLCKRIVNSNSEQE